MAIAKPVTKTLISTTAWGIPITDQVNANTAAIAANVPTAWANLALINGWINYPNYYACQYRKIGDIVYVRGSLQEPGAAVGAFAVMPVGFRPNRQAEYVGVAYAGQRRTVSIVIGTDGQMVMDVLGSGVVSSFPTIFFATN